LSGIPGCLPRVRISLYRNLKTTKGGRREGKSREEARNAVSELSKPAERRSPPKKKLIVTPIGKEGRRSFFGRPNKAEFCWGEKSGRGE